MRKWILPVFALVLSLGIGNAVDTKAMTTQEKRQKQAEEQALHEEFSEKPVMLRENTDGNVSRADDGETLPASGTLPCENGNTISYTLDNGVLTISGSGDVLTSESRYYFCESDITKVVFTADCTMTDLTGMFQDCHNLTAVENIPETVTELNFTFSRTGLTSVPKLPEHLVSMEYVFSGCGGITEVDWSSLPETIESFSGAFSSTSITNAVIVMNNSLLDGTFSYSYVFSDCPLLKTVTVDAAGLNDEASLWLQGICSGCSSLERFELIHIPATNSSPGSVCSTAMFEECSQLTSVINEGYFDFSGDNLFYECSQLSTLETKGFRDFYGDDSLENMFYNCSSLSGDYYISFTDNCMLYDYAADLAGSDLETEIGYSFTGCNSKTNFHLGFQALVNYWNQRKLLDKSKSEAVFSYWPEGDHYTAPPVATPPYTPVTRPGNTSVTPVVSVPVSGPATANPPVKPAASKKISVLKLTKYKKGAKTVSGKTIGKATVKITIGKKTYKVKSNGKGNFSIKLKSKLKKKTSIKVTVSKSGYISKSKTFKVK